jgi:hypothetical protein
LSIFSLPVEVEAAVVKTPTQLQALEVERGAPVVFCRAL